jgi:hypothetical protein
MTSWNWFRLVGIINKPLRLYQRVIWLRRQSPMNQDQQLSMLDWLLRSGAGHSKAAAHRKTLTWFKEVLWRSLGNLFNHCLEFYLDTRGFFPKNSFNRSLGQEINISIGFVRSSIFQCRTNYLGPPKEFLWANWDIFARKHTTCFGLPKEFLQASRGIFAQRLLS